MTSITRMPSATRFDRLPEFGAHVPRPGCPAWCVDEHCAPIDDNEHISKIHGVELAAHSVTVPDLNGEWGTYPLEILVTIEIHDGKSPHITLVGHDDGIAGDLSPDEADRHADILHTLAATARGAHP